MTEPRTSPPWHDLADHISEVRLRVGAASLGELLAEAGRALARLQLRGAAPRAGGEWRTIEVSAGDRAALLAEWLNELIFLAETERWVAAEFEVESAGDRRMRARARGMRLERVPGLVKAATLHRLRVVDVPGGLEGDVVLDV